MKVLYVVRLFSGLTTSLASGHWSPTGAPAIYKVIEALDQGDMLAHLVFTCKDEGSGWPEPNDATLVVDGLRTKVTVLAGECAFPEWLGRFCRVLSEMRQLWQIWLAYRKFTPDLMYFDHANLWAAGLSARYLNVPVVLRVMGIYPVMRESFQTWRLAFLIMRWAYRAPYAAVICTQDGSGGEFWLEKALAADVPRRLFINGVDLGESSEVQYPWLATLPSDKTVVLFLGKLEREKGCEEFLIGFLRSLEQDRTGLHAVVVGTGSRASALHEMVAWHRVTDMVTFIPRLPHAEILFAYRRADIYVSLNRLGNLSNANLEAMRVGCCMVFPASQPGIGVDLITDKLVSGDAALRIPSVDDTTALANAILRLHRNSTERRALGEAMASAAQKFIPSWEQRVEAEMDLLKRIANARKRRVVCGA